MKTQAQTNARLIWGEMAGAAMSRWMTGRAAKVPDIASLEWTCAVVEMRLREIAAIAGARR